MEAGQNFNQEISDQDLANDPRQKRPIFSVLEDDVRPEFVNWTSLISKELNGHNDLSKKVDEIIDAAEVRHPQKPFYASQYFEPQLTPQELQVTFNLLFRDAKLRDSIFTGNNIRDHRDNPLQLVLVGEDQVTPVYLDFVLKVEIVVLDGNFPEAGRENWSSPEFDAKIVKERSGKRPLLLGNLIVPLIGGSATIEDIKITDNSSWIPSGKFKIGARVVPRKNTQGLRVREAMTEASKVLDSRGESYKKHHPPMLDDEVWRLVKIMKEGVRHKKLASEGIETVRDFLNLSATDPRRLKGMLGQKMSAKAWKAVLEHANTCKILSHEQGGTDRVQQGILTETTSLNQGVLMEQQNHSHVQPIGDSHTFHQQGIMTESTLPTQVVFMERQNISHVQPDEHLKNNDDGEGSVSFRSQDLQALLGSPSQLNNFNPAGFQVDGFFSSPSQFDRFNPGFPLDD